MNAKNMTDPKNVMFSSVVLGEAPESDNEDEISFKNKHGQQTVDLDKNKVIRGEVIIGEASESEDEGASISSAVSAMKHLNTSVSKTEINEDEKFDSLLHKRLRDSNLELRANINDYVNRVIETSNKDLKNTNNQLLQSQIVLQQAVTSLQALQYNADVLKAKLKDTVNANFLPNIIIPKPI